MTEPSRKDDRDHLVGRVMCSWNAYQVTGATIVSRARGAKIWDAKGREYLDWNMGWGSLVLGHTPDAIRAGVMRALDEGFGFPYESDAAAEFTRLVCEMTRMDQVRLCNSGMEATQHAVRLARRATGRKTIVKFEGHFHGLHDGLLFALDAGKPPGALKADGTIEPVPASAGVPEELAGLVRVIPYNDAEALHRVFAAHPGEIAAVIMEPIALNMGCILPDPDFLEDVRRTCDTHGSLLIFDEVRTGFRSAPGGAAELLRVAPDLVCYGKAIGCGMPMAAIAGRREAMQYLSPVGDVEVAGTNTGRNITIQGSLAALKVLAEPGFHQALERLQDRFVDGCRAVLAGRGIPHYVTGTGGTIGVYLGTTERPRSFRDVLARWNRAYQAACYQAAHEAHGLYGFLLPQADCPEAVVLSTEHTPAVIDETLDRFDRILASIPYFEK